MIFIDFSCRFGGLSCNLHFFSNPLLKCALSQRIGGVCLWAGVYSHAVFDIFVLVIPVELSLERESSTNYSTWRTLQLSASCLKAYARQLMLGLICNG